MNINIDSSARSFFPRVLIVCGLIFSANAAPRTYNNALANGNDVPVASVTDSRGNLYVTGYSANAQSSWRNPNPPTDIVTVKYSPDGVQRWAIRYDGPARLHDFPSAITVDADDNVYVTGSTEYEFGKYNFVTIRYDAAVITPWGFEIQPQTHNWAEVWIEPNASTAKAVGLVVDNDGRLFVTGTMVAEADNNEYIVTLRYDRENHEENQEEIGPGAFYIGGKARAIAADGNGHVYVAGTEDTDIVTLQYSAADFIENGPEPEPNWNPLSNVGGTDTPVALMVFGTSIYVAGYSAEGNDDGDFLLIKYDDQGEKQWAALEGTGDNLDRATAMAIDSAGNIYVTGYAVGEFDFATQAFDRNYLTLKYTPAGALARFWMYGANGNRDDCSTAIGIDGNDRVYITGYSRNVAGDAYDCLTARLNPLGGFTWTKRFTGTANANTANRIMAVSDTGFVHVTGTDLTVEQQANFQTIKYRWDNLQPW